MTCMGMKKWNTYQTGNDYLFANFLFLISKEGDRVTSSSCATANTVIDASSMSLEALIAHYRMQGPMNGSTFSLANNYLFDNLLFLVSGEDDRLTLTSCVAPIMAIDASSMSLEALIATYDMHGDDKGEHFPNRKRLLFS